MLAPVSCHERDAHQCEWDEEDEDAGARVDELVHGVQEDVVCDFAAAGFERETGLLVAQEVARQIEPDEQVEAADVVQKVQYAVALVADC